MNATDNASILDDIAFTELVDAYLEAGLWSTAMPDHYDGSGGGNGYMDDHYWPENCENRAEVEAEVRDFIDGNADDIAELLGRGVAVAQIGHDFLLTRDHHGAGFWDRGYGDVGDRLSDAARVYGESNFQPTGWVELDRLQADRYRAVYGDPDRHGFVLVRDENNAWHGIDYVHAGFTAG